MSNSSSSLFLLLFVTISSCYQNRNLILLCGLNTWKAKAAHSLQTMLKVKCSKWMDQIFCGGLDVGEIIARKALLWMLTACVKQFFSCLSTFQQLSGLVVPEWTVVEHLHSQVIWPWLAGNSTMLWKLCLMRFVFLHTWRTGLKWPLNFWC